MRLHILNDLVPRLILGAVLIPGTALFPDTLQAQGSGTAGCSVVERVDCTLLYRSDGQWREERRWPTAIVLWRMPPDSLIHGATRQAQLDATGFRYRQLRRAAEDSGWTYIGGRSGMVIQDLATDSKNNRIRIGDRTFVVPEHDSTLVVMVDLTRDSAYTPVITGHAFVPAALPDGYWTMHWVSGDTTFSVRPRNTEVMLTRLLRSNSMIAAFLDET